MSSAYTGTPHHGFILSFLQWYNRQNLVVTFTGNTMLNIVQSFYRPLYIEAKYANIILANNKWISLTSAVDIVSLSTTKNVTLT